MSQEKQEKETSLQLQAEPALQLSLPKTMEASKQEGEILASLPARIAIEHNYAKLIPFRSSHGSGGKDSSFPTVTLFADKVGSKVKSKGLKGKRYSKQDKVKSSGGKVGGEEASNHGEGNKEGEGNTVSVPMEVEAAEGMSANSDLEAEEIIDVTSVDPVVALPYDEKKLSSIMIECARHMNLVKVPTDSVESENLIGRVLSECDSRQRTLLKQLINILEGDKLARLVCASVPHEPIKRRLNTDKAARKFRKALANVKWDSKLTRWCHEILLRVLDTSLLPIYLDILQVLKAKCPVLVEHMIHSSMGVAGGEAFGLLLKRPWNPAVGLYNNEKQVKFDPAPIFVSLPYSSSGLGGRRWRMWQTQLGIIGKVYPIILPESVTDISLNVGLHELAEQMLLCSLNRVQELSSHFPTRPVVLIGFSLAGRIAAKIAEFVPVAMIISLGLPCSGIDHKWKLSADPLKDCVVPTSFVVGSDSRFCSSNYIEKLRTKMKSSTQLTVVGGGDDLLRLSMEDKQQEEVTQSIIDRCIMDEIYKFMVHTLPCTFPEEQHRLIPRKRKTVHTEDIVSSTFLTPIVSQGPIVLTPNLDESGHDGRNFNFNNSSSPFWRTFLNLKQSGRVSPGSISSSPSPIAFLERRLSGEGMPSAKKHVSAELFPKIGRPRSKSTAADKPKKKTPSRSRSRSSDQANKNATPENCKGPPSNTFTPIDFSATALNGNTNNSNNVNVSPPSSGLLALPPTHFRPLPITPPRNPFENEPISDRQLDPKTLRHLQLK